MNYIVTTTDEDKISFWDAGKGLVDVISDQVAMSGVDIGHK